MMLVEAFTRQCDAEHQQVLRLVALLEEEQQALIQGQDMQLEPLAESKSRVLDQLAGLATERARLMQQQGVQDSDTLYIWLADKPEACAAWVRLEEAVNRAQSINQLNGSFIDQRLSRVEEALDTLRSAASATLGYDRGGHQPEVMGGGRFLGSA